MITQDTGFMLLNIWLLAAIVLMSFDKSIGTVFCLAVGLYYAYELGEAFKNDGGNDEH